MGYASSVCGGFVNSATGDHASVSGGRDNLAGGVYSTISGGSNRSVFGADDWRAGTYYSDN